MHALLNPLRRLETVIRPIPTPAPPSHRGPPTSGPGESAYPTRPAAARHEGPEGTRRDRQRHAGAVGSRRRRPARSGVASLNGGSVRVGSVCVAVAVAVAVNWAVPWLSMTNRADSPNNGYSLSTRQSRKREESLCSLLHSHPADPPNAGYSLSTRQSRKRSLTITVTITVNSRSQFSNCFYGPCTRCTHF